jgi:hypothetical protein
MTTLRTTPKPRLLRAKLARLEERLFAISVYAFKHPSPAADQRRDELAQRVNQLRALVWLCDHEVLDS